MTTDPTDGLSSSLAPDVAQAWCRIAREVIGTAYPWAPGHLVLSHEDTQVVPHRLHPAFHGALDWHSCVHMQWSLVTLLHRYGAGLGENEAAAARALLGERLTPGQVEVEVAYLRARPGYERPYGWAWAAQLVAAVADLRDAGDDDAQRWAEALATLEEHLADAVLAHLPRQAYPVRDGRHQNDAFALLLLLDAYRRPTGRVDVERACRRRAVQWYAADVPAATGHEPGGSDFLSPALTEALLMTRVLDDGEARSWLERFLPGLGAGAHEHLLEPPQVLDPTDGQGAHLLGLALSRAWALRNLAPWVPSAAARRLRAAATVQEASVLPQITDGDFMATHWLVSFALLAQGAVES